MTRKIIAVLLFAFVVAGGCRGNTPREPNPAFVDAGLHPAVPAESLYLADGMIRILREELTAPDPGTSLRAFLCESMRVDRLFGEEMANRLTSAAYTVAHKDVPDSTLRRIDAALATRTFRMGEGCDSLAKAGVLGDTFLPPPRPPVR